MPLTRLYAFTKVARLDDVDTFVTDSGLDQDVIDRYEGLGKKLIVV